MQHSRKECCMAGKKRTSRKAKNMEVQLRDYQQQTVEQIRESYRRQNQRVLLTSPTGSGKTVMFAYIVRQAVAKGNRVLIVAHRRELIHQIRDQLGMRAGLIIAGEPEHPELPVQVGTIQTICRRSLSAFDLIVVDECHHVRSRSYMTLLAAQKSAKILGVTATPFRLDGQGLGEIFEDMVQGPKTGELIDRGFLSKFKVYMPPTDMDLEGVRIVRGDYDLKVLAERVDRQSICGGIVSHFKRFAGNRQAVCFAVNVSHSEHLAEAFQAAGLNAAHIDANTKNRDAVVAAFARKDIQILTNCDIISEGFDVPAIGAVILARPTQSRGLYIQQVGRGLRPGAGASHCIILDHADNTLRHGLITDPLPLSLDMDLRKEARANKDRLTPKVCPECNTVCTPQQWKCECGYEFYEKKQRGVRRIKGQLKQVFLRQIHVIGAPEGTHLYQDGEFLITTHEFSYTESRYTVAFDGNTGLYNGRLARIDQPRDLAHLIADPTREDIEADWQRLVQLQEETGEVDVWFCLVERWGKKTLRQWLTKEEIQELRMKEHERNMEAHDDMGYEERLEVIVKKQEAKQKRKSELHQNMDQLMAKLGTLTKQKKSQDTQQS